jgi:hypothetical protein
MKNIEGNDVYTYFIQAVGTELVKIGKACSIYRRLKSLQTTCPHQLKLLGVTALEEKTVQDKFSKFKKINEWYELSGEIKEFIDKNTFIPDSTPLSKNWSVQLSIPLATYLKEYCKDNGFKMKWFVENAIHLCITGSLIVSCVRAGALNSGSYEK